jgi:hypothetical protein
LRAFWAFRAFSASLSFEASLPRWPRRKLDRRDLVLQLHPHGLDVRAQRARVRVLVDSKQIDEQRAEPLPEFGPLVFREHFFFFFFTFFFVAPCLFFAFLKVPHARNKPAAASVQKS